MTTLPLPKMVVLESPFRATPERTEEQHRVYLQHCMEDCKSRGEYPFASHLYMTLILNDDNPYERAWGIQGGWEWGKHAEKVVVYRDMGLSDGMMQSIAHYKSLGKEVEYRSIDQRLVLAVCAM